MRVRSSLLLLTIGLAACGGDSRYPQQCGAPLAGWRKPSDGYGVLAIINRVTIKRNGSVLWNGKPITTPELAEYSAVLPQMNPVPFTILQIENGADCSVVSSVRSTINDRAKCADGRCGEGPDPWAQIGDVIGPNGETYKYYPDGRTETIQPTERQRAAINQITNEADAALSRAKKR